MKKMAKVLPWLLVLALAYILWLKDSPAPSGVVAKKETFVKAPVAPAQLSPKSGAKPSASVEDVKEVKKTNSGIYAVRMTPTFKP